MVEPILFPCIVTIGDRLYLTTKREALRFLIKTHLEDNRFLLTRGVSEQFKISFFVDRRGAFREVREIRMRRQWTKAIGWLHDFTLRECEICPGIELSVGELLARVDPLKAKHPSDTGQVRPFLRKLPSDAPFDEHRFRELWNHYGQALPPNDWKEKFP